MWQPAWSNITGIYLPSLCQTGQFKIFILNMKIQTLHFLFISVNHILSGLSTISATRIIMATNLPFNARQLYSALRGGKSLSRCPPSLISTSLISTNMLKRRAKSLFFPSSLTVSTIQQAEYTQRAVINGEETDLSDSAERLTHV